MSLTALDTAGTPPRAPRRAPPAVRGKLRTVLESMVYEGKPWDQAAREAGLTTQAVRKALAKQHVQRFLKNTRQVFREGASAQNEHRAAEIRDTSKNHTAAIQAIRYLDGMGEREQHTADGQRVSPGVVVNVAVVTGEGRSVDTTVIEVNPSAIAASEAADNEG